MIGDAVLDFLLRVVDWVLDRFESLGLPDVVFPSALSLVVPIPTLGSRAAALNVWFSTSVLVVGVLIVAKALQWVYGLLPTK
jgi:hypothetical protein